LVYIKECCFQHKWSQFNKWPWPHYDKENDSAFCFTCTKEMKLKKLKTENMKACFIFSGYIHHLEGYHLCGLQSNFKGAASNTCINLYLYYIAPCPLYIASYVCNGKPVGLTTFWGSYSFALHHFTTKLLLFCCLAT